MNRTESIIHSFEKAQQGHVFAAWDRLNTTQQATLLQQAQQIDLLQLKESILATQQTTKKEFYWNACSPPDVIRHPSHGGSSAIWENAYKKGEAYIKKGKVAVFTVAGGQGTRLGVSVPKGLLEVSPIKKKTLFELFAQKIKASQDYYAVNIPWFIMTSQFNHESTVAYFEKNKYFGLGSVYFFKQSLMPSIGFDGRILLENPFTIAMNPDGHGGAFKALVKSGAIDTMKSRGIELISYFQVDNPLVQCVDPFFIGFHLENQSEFTSKVLLKKDPAERVGIFCKHKGQLNVIEYIDLPLDKANQRDTDQQLTYRWSNAAIHLLNIDFVNNIGGNHYQYQLPYSCSPKMIPVYDSHTQKTIQPTVNNGFKIESFIFDALIWAKNPTLVEVLREEEFSPIKNVSGADTIENAKKAQIALHTHWLKEVEGVLPPRSQYNEFTIEISPLFAPTKELFLKKWHNLASQPTITTNLYLE